MFITLLPGIITTAAFLWLNIGSWTTSGFSTLRTEYGPRTEKYSSTKYTFNGECLPMIASWWGFYYFFSFSNWVLFPTMALVAIPVFFFLKR